MPPRHNKAESGVKFLLRLGPTVPPELDDRPPQSEFEFVNGKDQESRRRVRKHVMRGWRKQKKQQFDAEVGKTKSQVGWISNPPSPGSRTDLDVSTSYESSPYLSPFNIPYGVDDVSSVEGDHPTTSDLGKLKEGVVGNAAIQFPEASTESYLDETAEGDDNSSPAQLYRKLEAIRQVQEALSDPKNAISDETIQTALFIASDESRMGNYKDARIHLSGLRRMVQLRSQSVKPLSFELEIQLLSGECLIPTAQDSILFSMSRIPSECEYLIDFLAQIHFFPYSIPRTFQETSSSSPEQPEYFIAKNTHLHSLLSEFPRATTRSFSQHIEQCAQLASLFFICVTISELQLQTPHPAHLTELTSSVTATTSPSAVLWILLSSLNDDRGRGWRVARMVHVAKMVLPETRERLRNLMVQFLTSNGVDTPGVENSGVWRFDPEELRNEILSVSIESAGVDLH